MVFEAVEGGTLMRFTQTGFARRASRDGHGDGWSQCFERLRASHPGLTRSGEPMRQGGARHPPDAPGGGPG